MASTFENDLRLEEIGTGEQSGTWGATTNTNLELIAEAFSYGTEAITTNADTHATVIADGATDEGRSMYLKYTGTLDSTCTITISAGSAGTFTLSKVWMIENATSGGQSIIITSGSGASVTIANGQVKMVATDGAGSGGIVYDILQDIAIPDLFVDDDFTLQSDGAIINFGADSDVNLTHVADTGLLLNSTRQLQFGDSGTYIHQSADGVLDLVSDTEIEINATTIDINGNVDISGTTVSTGKITADAGIDIDNFNIDGTTIALSSGDMLLDGAGDIILDADGGDVLLKDDGTQYASFTNTSGNLIIKSGSTTAMTFSGANVTFAGTVTIGSAGISEAELEILDGATVTTAELNILDGDTSATSTTVVDADRVVLNDNGTMVQVAVTDLATYFASEITAMSNLTSVGTLTTLTVDNVIINGTTIGHTSDTDLITLADGIATVAGEISVTTLDIGGTNVSATAGELNIMDGDTSATSTTLADADRVVVNDNGTMVQVALTDFETYFESALDTLSNVTTVGALDSGSITSGFGAIDNGTSGIRSNTVTVETSLLPDTASGADIGSTSAEFGDVYIGDDKYIQFGSDQDVLVGYDEDGDDSLEFRQNVEGAALALTFKADQGDDNDDQWKLNFADGGTVTFQNKTSGSYASKLTIDKDGDVTIAGDLTVSGDDITMATNTSGNLLVADGTNFNSVAVGDLSEISSVANDDVFLAVDTSGGGLKKITRSTIVSGLAVSGAAIANVVEDSTPQLGGDLDVNGNGLVSTSNGNIALTPNGTGVVRIDGNVDIQSGLIDLKNAGAVSKIKFYCESSNQHAQTLQGAPHSETASNTLTLPSTGGDVNLVSTASTATLTNKTFGDNVSFGDNNITNVGDIALDSISADGTDINVAVSDNSATALTIKQGSDAYLIIDTANSSESVSIGTGVSGTAITLGHSTSEVTVSDNLTVTGNLTVSGTTTTVDTTNTTIKDNLLELNSGASSNSNDVGIIIQRGSTGNDALIMWDESADKWTLGTTTSSAGDTGNLNITAGTLVANLEGDVTGDVTGNADTATTLATARNIGGVSFNGSANINLPGVNTAGNQDTSGNAATATALATARTIHGVSFDGTANIDLSEVVQDTVGAMFSSNTETGITATYQDSDGTIDLVVGTLNQDTTGNAATATALETARTIHGVSFDGTGNIDLTEVVQDTVGAMFSSNTETGITATYQDSDGTIDLVVGTLNQDTTGSAATLTTARNIGGVSFDGSANINLPGVNTSGNQDTSGNAATATALATARTINGTSFDGTGNITLGSGSVTAAMMAANSIDSDSYVDGSIDTAHIGDDQVTYAKIQNVSATDRILGRDSAGAGVIEEITPANLRTMINVADGATANSAGSGITISSGSISHADTSSQASVDNSGSTFIQDVTLDTYGHVTGLTSATVSASGTQDALIHGTGNRNTVGGDDAFNSAVTGMDDNTIIGYHALKDGNSNRLDYNVAVGSYALENYRIVFGSTAGYGQCVAIGYKAMRNIYLGTGHTAVGHGAMMGANASGELADAFSGMYNIGVGAFANRGKMTGSYNAVMGFNAQFHGDSSASGNYNTVLGASAKTSSNSSSGQFVLGDSNISDLRCNDTSISSLSDRRDKTDIVDCPFGLTFLNSLRPVQFKWNKRKLDEIENKEGRVDPLNGKTRVGFIAQELQEAQNKIGETTNDILNLVRTDNPRRIEAKQGNLLPVIVKAVQELSAKVEALTTRVTALE